MRRVLFLAVLATALWAAPGAFAAGWCGGATESRADRPDIVTGQQVHAVVAVAADGIDTFPGLAGRLADDVASITTWWLGQDPTRAPRFDQARFGDTACLDVSFVRLAERAQPFLVPDELYDAISRSLVGGGLANPNKKYLVYYEGQSSEPLVCGVGGQNPFGPDLAVILLGACTGVFIDQVATHELLHALGANPRGDTNNPCPDDPGHPCDSQTDVLYPYTEGDPLSALVLDYNHDDYYGHSGTWFDVQDSPWLHRPDAAQVPLAVALSGGRGAVHSDVPGVDCSAACTTQWDQGSSVELDAVPGASARFVGWTGSCKGAGACRLTLSQAASATAVFGPLRIPLRLSVAGKGRVTCVPQCGRSFPGGGSLLLRAVATKGWRFAGWTGACKGRGAVCRPKTDYALTTRAVFKRR